MRPATYVIHVDGTLPVEEAERLVGMAVIGGGKHDTVLRGVVSDQAALAGKLRRIESLGCTVRDFSLVRSRPAADDRDYSWG